MAGQERLYLFFLPRYAPELNADEYLNQDLKQQVNAEGLPESKPALRSRIQAVMQRLLHLPEHVRNYFQHPCVQYAGSLYGVRILCATVICCPGSRRRRQPNE